MGCLFFFDAVGENGIQYSMSYNSYLCGEIELARDGITANAVAPGPTETELFRANSPAGSEGEKRFLAQVPVGRFAHPQEIATAIAFLASDSAGFITGQTLFVDGGASLGTL